MTKEQKLEKLKEAIISAVPEIIELKIYCDNHSCNHKEPLEEEHCWCCGSNIIRKEKVLRPITLEDILITLDKKYPGSILVVVNTERGVIIKRELATVFELWEFGKDLDWHAKNKPETIDFLYNLICKNEKNNH